jgi:hypothetical protein
MQRERERQRKRESVHTYTNTHTHTLYSTGASLAGINVYPIGKYIYTCINVCPMYMCARACVMCERESAREREERESESESERESLCIIAPVHPSRRG